MRFHQNMNVISRSTEASWLCLLLSHDVSSALQPDISARPMPGLPQAPLLDKRPAIIADFKDATHSKTAFMHLFWQAPVHSPFLAFSPFHLPPPYPSFLLSHQPSSLFRWAIKERNKCKSSLVWHRWLLTHSLLKYLLVFLSTKFGWSGYQQRWGRCGSHVSKQGAFSPGHWDHPFPPPADLEIKPKGGRRTCFTFCHLHNSFTSVKMLNL